MTTDDKIFTALWQSPVGALLIGSYGDRICLCDWVDSRRHASNLRRLHRHLGAPFVDAPSPAISLAIACLEEYFAGARREFSAIPLLLVGTPMQRSVWQALAAIPYAATVSYSALAESAGCRASAARAVATIVASNPISILVPCHRVIGADGRLTGYAGGLPAKRALLALEGGIPPLPLQ